MATFTLPLDPIANIMVNLSARSAVRKAFNLALLMGDVPDDVEFGSVRIKTYANTTEMLQDGFTTDDRLYKAAELVFGQDKKPPLVAVGKALKTSGTLEQPVATLHACREEDGEWYLGIYCGDLTEEQLIACAQLSNLFVQTPCLPIRRVTQRPMASKMAGFLQSSKIWGIADRLGSLVLSMRTPYALLWGGRWGP